jgi:hypothetical protein
MRTLRSGSDTEREKAKQAVGAPGSYLVGSLQANLYLSTHKKRTIHIYEYCTDY